MLIRRISIEWRRETSKIRLGWFYMNFIWIFTEIVTQKSVDFLLEGNSKIPPKPIFVLIQGTSVQNLSQIERVVWSEIPYLEMSNFSCILYITHSLSWSFIPRRPHTDAATNSLKLAVDRRSTAFLRYQVRASRGLVTGPTSSLPLHSISSFLLFFSFLFLFIFFIFFFFFFFFFLFFSFLISSSFFVFLLISYKVFLKLFL